MTVRRLCLVAAVCLLASAGCDPDPGEGKTKATAGAVKSGVTKVDIAKFGGMKISADSKIEFVGSNPTNNHTGGFKTIKGGIKLKDGKAEGGAVAIEIDVKSTYSDDEDLTTHLKSADFFEVSKHPTATFRSTKVAKGGTATHKVTGDLTVRGKTREITFDATIKVDGGNVDVKAEFVINRKDFGIMYKGSADSIIKDNVAITVTLKASK